MDEKTLKKLQPYYKLNTPYALTVNPNNKRQYNNNADRWAKVRNYLYELIMGCQCYYDMYMEISEPYGERIDAYQGPRIHMHGVIIFRSKKELAQFLLFDSYRINRESTTNISTIDDVEYWYKYCTKQKIFKKNRLSNNEYKFIKYLSQGETKSNPEDL